MEKKFHYNLKSVVSKHLKSKGFSVKKEAKIKHLAVDVMARKNNSAFLFECEIPSKYAKFISYNNKNKKGIIKACVSTTCFC